MPRKKNPQNQYWNQAVEDAVCVYNSTEDTIEKDKAYRIIYPALCKVAEVMYHKVKFSYSDDYMEDTMADCVVHLTENLGKFHCGKGTKSFSYFTVCAKYFYIQLSNRNYKYFQRTIPISSMDEKWDKENSDRDDELKSQTAQLFYGFLAYCEHNFEKMFNVKYQPYARVVLDTISNFEHIQDFRRRKLLGVIFRNGNMSEAEKNIVTKQINVMTTHLTLFKERWQTGDNSLDICRKTHLTEEEQQIVRDTVIPGKRNNGSLVLAKRFGVDVKVIYDYLKSTI